MMIPYSQNPSIVLLSVCIAIVGCLTGLPFVWNTQAKTAQKPNLASVYRGAVIIGGTIWAMHFIAMNAIEAAVPITYEVTTTAFSLLIALVVTGLGLYLANSRGAGSFRLPLGGAIMGLGIAGMHYLGMDAVRGCSVRYASDEVVLSILIGVVASSFALIFSQRQRSILATISGSVILGVAICALHYTAMHATTFIPVQTPRSLEIATINAGLLASIIGLGWLTYSAADLGKFGVYEGITSDRKNRSHGAADARNVFPLRDDDNGTSPSASYNVAINPPSHRKSDEHRAEELAGADAPPLEPGIDSWSYADDLSPGLDDGLFERHIT
jgi:NO-binding membrane sensor protein with MHYT domain